MCLTASVQGYALASDPDDDADINKEVFDWNGAFQVRTAGTEEYYGAASTRKTPNTFRYPSFHALRLSPYPHISVPPSAASPVYSGRSLLVSNVGRDMEDNIRVISPPSLACFLTLQLAYRREQLFLSLGVCNFDV